LDRNMPNFKAPALVAASAFLISFLVGIASAASFPLAIIRPLLFAAGFFAIVCAISWLTRRYLLTDNGARGNPAAVGENAAGQTGRTIDVSVGEDAEDLGADFKFTDFGDAGGGTAAAAAGTQRNSPETEGKADGGLDVSGNDDYTIHGDRPSAAEVPEAFAWLNEAPATVAGADEISADGSHYLKKIAVKGAEFEFDAQKDGKKMAGAIQGLLRDDD
jgi:hypothetical protein